MKYIEDIKNDIDDLILSFIKKSERVTAEDLGLDSSAGGALYVFPDGIGVTNKGTKNLENFGGFDTIDRSDIVSYGNYTFYLATSEKVTECLEFYGNEYEEVPEEDDEDEDDINESLEDDEDDNPHDSREEEDEEYEYNYDEEEDEDEEDEEYTDEEESKLREIIHEELLKLLNEK